MQDRGEQRESEAKQEADDRPLAPFATRSNSMQDVPLHQDYISISSPWLAPPQAVKYLEMPSLKALYQAVRRGQIPVHRLGRRMRFHRTELDQLLLGGKARPPSGIR
jgi:excisionase family DNA binding protein